MPHGSVDQERLAEAAMQLLNAADANE